MTAHPIGEDGDSAAEAFEALRLELAGLRRDLEVWPQGEAPDYAPTLSAIAGSVASIEQHPALQLTPTAFAAEVDQAAQCLSAHERRQLAEAVRCVDGAAAALSRLVDRGRAAHAQRRWLIIAGAGGLAIGLMLGLWFSGPIERALPARWRLAEGEAAVVRSADPDPPIPVSAERPRHRLRVGGR